MHSKSVIKFNLLVLMLSASSHLYAEIIESFSEIELTSRTKNYQILTTDDQTWNARITIPEMNSVNKKAKYPLIIGLHWLATSKKNQDQAYINYSSCLLEPVFTNLNAFIIAPQANEILWHSENNQVRILSLIEQAKKHWPIDEDKIVITGYSQGGVGTWFYADTYPDIFSAAIPIASSYPKIPNSSIDIPMYVIHSKDDETFPVKRIKSRVREYRKKGTDITYVQNKLSHYKACKYDKYLDKSLAWLSNDVWEIKKPSKNEGLEHNDKSITTKH